MLLGKRSSAGYGDRVSRRTPPDRVNEVARAAWKVFIEKGYRRTLMTDIGTELNLSHATLYHCVDSKEALFELAMHYAMDPESVSALQVPLPAPAPGHTLQLLQQWARKNVTFPVLHAALAREDVEDGASELLEIIDERYAFVERNRRLLALIERSALDLPELHALYYQKLRRNDIRQLSQYLERRITAGLLGDVSDIQVATRFIVETIAWFAWHRMADPDSASIQDEQARQTVRELLVDAFAPAGWHRAVRPRSATGSIAGVSRAGRR
jgi:AcrR family transcriptional regulator